MKPSTRHISLFILTTLLLAFASTSCGTVHGFGQDVTTAGDHIEDASR